MKHNPLHNFLPLRSHLGARGLLAGHPLHVPAGRAYEMSAYGEGCLGSDRNEYEYPGNKKETENRPLSPCLPPCLQNSSKILTKNIEIKLRADYTISLYKLKVERKGHNNE